LDDDDAGPSWRTFHSREVVNIVRVAESDPPRRILWEFEEEHGLYRGRWDVHLVPAGDGTRLVVTQKLNLRNAWARVIGLLVRRGSSLTLYLGALATHLEEPQPVQRTRPRS
jgi:hypothetical protein